MARFLSLTKDVDLLSGRGIGSSFTESVCCYAIIFSLSQSPLEFPSATRLVFHGFHSYWWRCFQGHV